MMKLNETWNLKNVVFRLFSSRKGFKIKNDKNLVSNKGSFQKEALKLLTMWSKGGVSPTFLDFFPFRTIRENCWLHFSIKIKGKLWIWSK